MNFYLEELRLKLKEFWENDASSLIQPIDDYMTEKYGSAYDPATKIISFSVNMQIQVEDKDNG
jgi:hypothetical protein